MSEITKSPSLAAGCLFVLAAPSGTGKTSLVNALLAREPGIRLSVSYTTRAPRPGEQEGVHYHFVDDTRFQALQQNGEFLETARVYDHWYATSAVWLKKQVEAGQDVLLEIDWQGAMQVRARFPDSVQIFVLPPSLATLRERLEKRGQDTPEVIARRLISVREEFRHYVDFDYVIINQTFDNAVEDLVAIIRAARLYAPRQRLRQARLLRELMTSAGC
ncbi:MAG: guanylate kinase [Burkholderiales bacterium]|jgi:guanylate kinase|nr:guanylate kinase [Burkholderiales bacterium]